MNLLIKILQVIVLFPVTLWFCWRTKIKDCSDVNTHLKIGVGVILPFMLVFAAQNAIAGKIRLIRDSQTEDFLWNIARPLLRAANLKVDDVEIYIVNDSSLNAFVMGGQNIFINTGLIIKYEDPNVLAGVMAHEIGHIAGGHLARGHEAMKDVGKVAILSYLAGIAAAIAGGGDAGYAVIMGSNHIAQRLAVKHTRTQEESADRLAMEYLKSTNNSPVGLMKLLIYFNSQESEYKDLVDEYALTHPVSQKRINYIKANLDRFGNKAYDLRAKTNMKYVVAKLKAFLQDSDKTLQYSNLNNGFDKYARSIAYFKKGDLDKSISHIDELINVQPRNGYFHELKGQILFENGLIKESIKSYKKSIDLLPNPALAKIALSAAIISLNNIDSDLINFAIKNLESAKLVEKNNGQIFQELAKAYFHLGQDGKAYLALSELNFLKQDNKKTRKYAKLALDSLPEDDKSNRIKAKDILVIIEDDVEKEDGLEE